MDKYKIKVQNSSDFYNTSFINFDFKLTEFNYKSLKPFFRGQVALELGPAIGQMTKYLIKDFTKLHLVEGAKHLLNQIPDYKNVIKYHSFFEEFQPTIKYETIIMGHVLEHIENPVALLKVIHTWLVDNGVLLISVPNAKSLHRLAAVEMGLIKNEFDLNNRDHELGHYRVYDFKSLKDHVIEGGFNIIDQGGIFLKPLSNGQIENNWNEEMIEGFYQLGKKFPNNCAEIFMVLGK